MPIYEYACKACRTEFELLVRGDERKECPQCKHSSLERLFSVVAAHSAAGRDVPMCETPSAGGCGLPQCGSGGCGMP